MFRLEMFSNTRHPTILPEKSGSKMTQNPPNVRIYRCLGEVLCLVRFLKVDWNIAKHGWHEKKPEVYCTFLGLMAAYLLQQSIYMAGRCPSKSPLAEGARSLTEHPTDGPVWPVTSNASEGGLQGRTRTSYLQRMFAEKNKLRLWAENETIGCRKVRKQIPLCSFFYDWSINN